MDRIIAITGNICTGKSAVGNILAKVGATVVSHDTFLYGAYAEPKCQEEIVACFGAAILVNGLIDRTSLKTYLKEHPEDCRRLWNITDKYSDPLVERFFQENRSLTFFECAPLYERSWDRFCEQVIACYVPDDLRIIRLIERARTRDGFYLSEKEAIAVMNQQEMSQEEKIKRADYVIYNDGNLESLERQTITLYHQIMKQK